MPCDHCQQVVNHVIELPREVIRNFLRKVKIVHFA